MPTSKKKRPPVSTSRVAKTRAAMRKQGMRPLQIWVPDVNAPGFAAKLARQCRLIAANERAETEALEFIEHVADTRGWTA